MILPIILIVLAILVVIIGIAGSKQNKKDLVAFKNSGVDFNSKIEAGNYVSGHPELNEPFNSCKLFFKGDDILIATNKDVVFKEKAVIPCDKVLQINVLDSSTIENKITLGRVLLVGVFALAWKKNKKKEMFFLEIAWNDGRFDHSTLFCFENFQSQQRANTARNALIKGLKK